VDRLYSLSLLAALVFGGLGAFLLAWILARRGRNSAAAGHFAVASLFCFLATSFCGAISMTVHLVFGHGPGAAEPMAALQFFSYHKAYWLVPALAVLSLLSTIIASRQARKRPPGEIR